MPTVPTVQGPTVQQAGIPDAMQRTPQALGAAGMTRAAQFGQASQVANTYGAVVQRENDLADQVRVDDAINQAKERQIDLTFGKDRGFTNLKGIAALQRESGQPLDVEYGEQYRKALSDIEGGLGNERQKMAFRMRANDMATSFRSQVTQYAGQEFQNYTVSVREGTIANSRQAIGLFYNDPQRIDEELLRIGAATADLGRTLGRSAEQIEADSRKQTSNALTVAIGAALEKNDVMLADGLLKKYRERMDADDLLRVRGVVDKQMDARVAIGVATEVVASTQAKAQPTDFDRLVSITMQSESGGRRFGADGQLLTSPAGAKGEMQVMDGTNKAPGFGVMPAKDDSPDERARVGRDYLQAMVKRYGGNLSQAWAAYNAGPGAVDKAMKESEKDAQTGAFRSGPPAADYWLTKMPKETQDYVRKNMTAYQAGEGRPAMPSLDQVHAAVRERVGTDNPARLKLALDESKRQWEDVQTGIKAREDKAVADAQRWLASNAGRFSAMPPSLREAVPPGQIDNLLNFADRVHKGEDRTNPAVYLKLSDPTFLKSLSQDQLYAMTSELSQADAKHFFALHAKPEGSAGKSPSDLNSAAIKGVLDKRLVDLQLDPTPKDGSAVAGQVGAIRRFIDQSVLSAQQVKGAPLNDAELIKHIDGLFMQTETVKGFFSDSSGPMLGMRAGDIPRAVADRLRQDFKAAGFDNPTDGQLLGAYWTARQRQPRRITPLKPNDPSGNF